MSKWKCGICGKDPAEGFASSWTQETGEVFYCHGDDDDVSCYERASWVGQGQPPADAEMDRHTSSPSHNAHGTGEGDTA